MINFVLFVDLQSPSVTPRKPLQSDNTSHSQEEDSYSVTLASFSNMDQVEFSSGSYWSVCLVSPFSLLFLCI